MNHPLRLAVGSHQAGTGKGCAMNVISWENGDTTITDFPACADQMLASIVQNVNDTYCMHRDGDLLCPACSVEVLDLAHRVVGSAGFAGRVVWVRLACFAARRVAHLNTDPRVMRAIEAAEAWAENPSDAAADAAIAAANAAADAANAANAANAAIAAANAANAAAAAASAAAYAAYAAIAAAYAAYAAHAAAYAANAAHAAAYAAIAANAAIAAASRMRMAHELIDEFNRLTGRVEAPAPAVEVTAVAVERMLARA